MVAYLTVEATPAVPTFTRNYELGCEDLEPAVHWGSFRMARKHQRPRCDLIAPTPDPAGTCRYPVTGGAPGLFDDHIALIGFAVITVNHRPIVNLLMTVIQDRQSLIERCLSRTGRSYTWPDRDLLAITYRFEAESGPGMLPNCRAPLLWAYDKSTRDQ